MCTNLFLLLLLLFTLPWEVIFLEIAIINVYNWRIQIVDAYTVLLMYTKYSLAIFSKILAYTIVIDKFVYPNFFLVPGEEILTYTIMLTSIIA